MRYKDVYDPDFLSLFQRRTAKRIGNQKFYDPRPNINVDFIARHIMHLGFVKVIMLDRTDVIYDKGQIMINITRDKQYQRFIIVREIMRQVLTQGKMTKAEFDRVCETGAKELLMPYKLVVYLMKRYKNEQNAKTWFDLNVDKMLDYLAYNMNVNKDTLRFRLIDLKILK